MSDTEKDRIFQLHAHHTGVLNIQSQLEVHNRQDLARAYTPGVAFLSQEIAKNPRLKRQYSKWEINCTHYRWVSRVGFRESGPSCRLTGH